MIKLEVCIESGVAVGRRKSIKWKSHMKWGFKRLTLGVVLVLIAICSVIIMGTLQFQETRKDPTEIAHQQFIQNLVPSSQKAYQLYQVLPSISLAQAILESDWGESGLSQNYYNLYGVKAGAAEPSVQLETSEYIDGKWITIMAPFRVYNSWAESVEAHAKLLTYGVDWNPKLYEPVLKAKNYKEAAHALQKAGYATDPTYAQKIIHVIETYHLAQYDQIQVKSVKE
ncbi:glycoside hydrolase family 73 protein [uncultured Granulicatella sp.]|uniref:glycoside hydrolase family 73 protein n=1 Tax=uncultured Granulicatella sp. TaxID=316089 RepID=UPI0028E5E865|nr:glycoside hydrolase family 73 protein [uncultured Granulicatella sp.]